MFYNIFLYLKYNSLVISILTYFCFDTFAFETFRKDCLQEKHIHAFESGSMDVDGDLRRQFVSIRLSIKVNSGRYGWSSYSPKGLEKSHKSYFAKSSPDKVLRNRLPPLLRTLVAESE